MAMKSLLGATQARGEVEGGGFNVIGVKHKLMNMLTLPRRGRIRIFINWNLIQKRFCWTNKHELNFTNILMHCRKSILCWFYLNVSGNWYNMLLQFWWMQWRQCRTYSKIGIDNRNHVMLVLSLKNLFEIKKSLKSNA